MDFSEINESLADSHQAGGYRRSARFQDHALVDHLHVGCRIDRKGQSQSSGPLVLEVIGLSVGGAELGLQSLPGDELRRRQNV